MMRPWSRAGEGHARRCRVQLRSGLSVPVALGGGPIGTLDGDALPREAGTKPRSARCRPLPGWSRPRSGPPPRPRSRTDWPSDSRSRSIPGPGRAVQGGADGPRTPGRQAGLRRSPASGLVLQAQAQRGGRRGGHRSTPAGWASRARKGGPGSTAGPGTLDAEVVAILEQKPDADGGIGHTVSLLPLGFLGTEVVPPADRPRRTRHRSVTTACLDRRHPAAVGRHPRASDHPR
jgi:hypothetical protein